MALPNLKHLQYLLALYEHKHFNRAADACYVSQSTLSNAIVKLEEQMACQLLERDHKSFIFTPQGEKIVEMARSIVVSATEMVDFAQQQGDPTKGLVRIGCIPTIAPYLLADLVKSCQQQLPQLQLYLDEDTTEQLLIKLANGEIDLALLALPIEKHGFQSKVLGKDNFYFAGSDKLIKIFKENSDFHSLPKQSVFLLSEEHCLTEHAVSACKLADKTRINSFSASSIATLIQMTAFHQGVTFLPAMAVNKGVGLAEGITIEAFADNIYREIGMLWRPTSLRRQTFSKLANIVEQILKQTS